MGRLKPLIHKGLFNAGLVKLTPTMVARYNRCLVSMGHQPTERKVIQVDGIGWSPQVARERRDPYYLHNGPSNPTAIIISPDQYKKPVYVPPFSWLRGAMRQVFEKYHREIIDTTATHVISIDFENGLSSFDGPLDLLLLTSVVAKPDTGNLAEAAVQQRQLVAQFMDGLNCLVTEPRDALIASQSAYGDLRRRRLEMGSVPFDLFSDFYTVAFGGGAVLRGVLDTDLLVLEDKDTYDSVVGAGPTHNAKICYLHDESAKHIDLLREAGMLTLPVDHFRADPKILEDKKDLLLSLSLCDCEGEDWNTCTSSKRKSLLKKHGEKVDPLFFELERYAAALRRGPVAPEPSVALWHFLAEPSERLPPGTREVLWILLTHRDPRNLLELYTHDKNRFLEHYGTWSDAKQQWAADYLAARYVPRMKQP
jgi:hypothetical protein